MGLMDGSQVGSNEHAGRMPVLNNLSRTALLLVPFAAAVVVAACSNEGPPEIGGKGLHCVDDSPQCIAQRSSALADLNNDKSRGWIRQPPQASAYASGVRLFAYKQKKRELNCEELNVARREADAGPAVLRGPDGKHLTTTQIARGVMLAQEVGRELTTEAKKRCKV